MESISTRKIAKTALSSATVCCEAERSDAERQGCLCGRAERLFGARMLERLWARDGRAARAWASGRARGDRWRRGTGMTAGSSICMSGLCSPSRRTNQTLGARQRRASVKQQSNDPDGALDLGFGRDDGVLVEESLGQADDRVG